MSKFLKKENPLTKSKQITLKLNCQIKVKLKKITCTTLEKIWDSGPTP